MRMLHAQRPLRRKAERTSLVSDRTPGLVANTFNKARVCAAVSIAQTAGGSTRRWEQTVAGVLPDVRDITEVDTNMPAGGHHATCDRIRRDETVSVVAGGVAGLSQRARRHDETAQAGRREHAPETRIKILCWSVSCRYATARLSVRLPESWRGRTVRYTLRSQYGMYGCARRAPTRSVKQ